MIEAVIIALIISKIKGEKMLNATEVCHTLKSGKTMLVKTIIRKDIKDLKSEINQLQSEGWKLKEIVQIHEDSDDSLAILMKPKN